MGGKRVRTAGTFPVTNPATEETIAEAPEVDRQTVQQALEAARDSFPTWSRMPLSQRQPIIFTDDDDVIAMANDTQYGLAAYVYTTNLSRSLRAAAEIQAGSVCVNEVHYAVQLPHGGLKQSGVGKDCSHYSIDEYLTLKRVSILV